MGRRQSRTRSRSTSPFHFFIQIPMPPPPQEILRLTTSSHGAHPLVPRSRQAWHHFDVERRGRQRCASAARVKGYCEAEDAGILEAPGGEGMLTTFQALNLIPLAPPVKRKFSSLPRGLPARCHVRPPRPIRRPSCRSLLSRCPILNAY